MGDGRAFGAAPGKPVLLAAFGPDSVPGTAVEHLKHAAPRLDPDGDLERQIADAIERPESAEPLAAAAAAAAFAEPGRAPANLRQAVYRLLRLPEPPTRPPVAAILPRDAVDAVTPTSWTVRTALTACGAVTVARFPAAASDGDNGTDGALRHLACDIDERDSRLRESASVLIGNDQHTSPAGAVRWARDALADHPGARLAATGLSGGGDLAVLRDGRVAEAVSTGPARDPGAVAAVAYALLVNALLLDGIVTYRLGRLPEQDVALRLLPGALPR